MSQPGGSANVNGILYQILGSLDHSCTAILAAADLDGKNFTSLRLIIEPTGGGGDVVTSTPTKRRVEQWKAKAAGGTWSLAKVVDDVLPDLYLGMPASIDGDDSEYAFMTEGRIGNWAGALELFANLPPPRKKPPYLKVFDDDVKRHAFGSMHLSDRGLFRKIVQRISLLAPVKRLKAVERETRVRHLLSRFRMPPPVARDRLLGRINSFLGDYVELEEHADAKRRELCGLLLELAASGDVTITAERLLELANVPLTSLRNWGGLQRRLRSRLQHHFGFTQYDANLDVRPHLIRSAWLTAVSGSAGQGKTWHLARFAAEVSHSQSLAVWVPAARNNQDPTIVASHEIWNVGLGRDQPLDLGRIAARRNRAKPDAPSPWAAICVDDVNTADEARFLASQEWQAWGIQLVFTTTPEIGSAVETMPNVDHVQLSDFGNSELHEFLRVRGKDWTKVSADVENLIRRPVLASIYADTEGRPEWTPEYEYEIVEAYWHKIADRTATAAMRALAWTLTEPGAPYPWLIESVARPPVDDRAIQHLTDAGWLKDAGEGTLAVWHDRLLGWAFAEALSARFLVGELSIDELCRLVADCNRGLLPIAGKANLSYAPLDILWQVFGSSEANPDDKRRLLESLEESFGHRSEILYDELIATLGTRAINPLVAHVEASETSDFNRTPRFAARALIVIGIRHRDHVATVARDAVAAEAGPLIELGLRLAAIFPERVSINRVWDIHRDRTISDDRTASQYAARNVSRRAFLAACDRDLPWLEAALQRHVGAPKELVELTYTLANMVSAEAAAIWQRQKKMLFDAIPIAKRRCLVFCVLAFRDDTEVPRLEEWAADEHEIVGVTALQVLAVFDLPRAARALPVVSSTQLWPSASAVGTALFAGVPQIACAAVRAKLQREREDRLAAFFLAAHHADRLDRELIDEFINNLDEALNKFQEADGRRGDHGLFHPLRLVDGLHGRIALDALRARRGSTFEGRLADFACGAADNSTGYADLEFDHAESILRRMAGDGFTRLVNVLLTARSPHSRVAGCQQAPIRADERTLRLLRDAALDAELWTSGTPDFPYIQHEAIDALAALGRNRDLVEAVLKWGNFISPEVSDLRAHQGPMSDDDIRGLADLLDATANPRHANAILAVGLSGRGDFTELVIRALESAGVGTSAALNAVLALEDLRADVTSTLPRLKAEYQYQPHKFAVLRMLFNAPVSPTGEYLFSLLPQDDNYDDLDEQLLAQLSQREDAKGQAVQRIRKYLSSQPRRRILRGLDPYAHLDPAQPSERDLLWEQARNAAAGSGRHGSRSMAIERLAETEPRDAYESALTAFLAQDPDREELLDVLLRIDRDRAAVDIANAVARVTTRAMARRIGIALRRHGVQETSKQRLQALIFADNWPARRAAVTVARYLGFDCLRDELIERLRIESRWEVYLETQESIRALQREQEAARVAATLTGLAAAEVWGTIDTITALADPEVIALQQDPVGLLGFLQNADFFLRQYAFKTLERRRKAIENDFQSMSGRWDEEEER